MRSYFLWLVNFSLPEDELPVLTFLFAYVRSYLNYVFVNRIEKGILGRVQKSIRKFCCTRRGLMKILLRAQGVVKDVIARVRDC